MQVDLLNALFDPLMQSNVAHSVCAQMIKQSNFDASTTQCVLSTVASASVQA